MSWFRSKIYLIDCNSWSIPTSSWRTSIDIWTRKHCCSRALAKHTCAATDIGCVAGQLRLDLIPWTLT
jgi:hypothetical protein